MIKETDQKQMIVNSSKSTFYLLFIVDIPISIVNNKDHCTSTVLPL